MVAVYIGMLVQIVDDSPLAPTSLSLFLVAGTFILAGFLHPQEFKCLPMGLVYMVTIPSMYLFLVIYSVFNLHVVSWGTREVAKKKTAQEIEEEKKKAEEEAKKGELKQRQQSGSFWGRLTGRTNKLGFFVRSEGELQKDIYQIKDKLDSIERALKKEGYTIPEQIPMKKPTIPTKPNKFVLPSSQEKEIEASVQRDELKNPYWIEQNDHLLNGPRRALTAEEITFWFDLIEKYLKPLEKDVEKEKKQANGLIELRNQMAFSFLMINGIWVVALFLMQLNKDKLSITWPVPNGPDLELEPLGLVFLLFFAVVLVMQLIGN